MPVNAYIWLEYLSLNRSGMKSSLTI